MKTPDSEKARNLPRRRFLTTLMQGLIGAGLAVTGGYLFLKEESEESCTLDFTCTLCGKSEQCGLPAASSYREYKSKREESR